MRKNNIILTLIAATIIIAIIVFWAWHKNNWWLLLGIPFSLFFFSNAQTVGHSLGYILTVVIVHIVYSAITGHFEFRVWSWFFFICGFMSYAAACIINGTEQSNWEKKARVNGDNRTFDEYEREKFLNSPEIKEITEKIIEKYKNSPKTD
jgi:hypothetical protein